MAVQKWTCKITAENLTEYNALKNKLSQIVLDQAPALLEDEAQLELILDYNGVNFQCVDC